MEDDDYSLRRPMRKKYHAEVYLKHTISYLKILLSTFKMHIKYALRTIFLDLPTQWAILKQTVFKTETECPGDGWRLCLKVTRWRWGVLGGAGGDGAGSAAKQTQLVRARSGLGLLGRALPAAPDRLRGADGPLSRANRIGSVNKGLSRIMKGFQVPEHSAQAISHVQCAFILGPGRKSLKRPTRRQDTPAGLRRRFSGNAPASRGKQRTQPGPMEKRIPVSAHNPFQHLRASTWLSLNALWKPKDIYG